MTLSHRSAPIVSIIAVIGAITLGGCRSTGEPLGLLLRGTFVLRTVNGAPLPADVSTLPGQETTLLADTLRFLGNGLAKLGQTERLQFSTSEPEVQHFTWDFSVRIEGEAIYLTFVCPSNANCINNVPVRGHLADANTLVLGDSKPYVYVRP